MKNFLIKIKNQKGYALLFTIMIISIISVITAGLINASTKQLILSSLARNSQLAFYQADTAGDCALYVDLVKTTEEIKKFIENGDLLSCGGDNLIISGEAEKNYSLTSKEFLGTNNPCFSINITKKDTSTVISAKGYNICDLSNPRVVEREIQISYEE